MTDDLIRKTFAGCLVLEKIGQGGMGVVYKAHHIKLNKVVCIKLLSKELEADSRNIDFFLREAEISKQLDHPNTVHVYDYGKEKDKYYIIMSYVEGKSVENLVKEKGFLSVEEASEIMLGVMRGLEHAHSKSIIHRDIKPSNIIINKEGIPRIIDFGLARRVIEEKQLTITGEMIGTAYFMSPEQGLGNKVDARTDLYSAGATYFYMLTGKYPFDGTSSIEVINKHVNAPLPNLYIIKPDLPIWTIRMIERLMKKKPEERYQSATEVIKELEKHKANGYKNILPQTHQIILDGIPEDKIEETKKEEKKQQDNKKTASVLSNITEEEKKKLNEIKQITSKFQDKKTFILLSLISHSFFVFLSWALLIGYGYVSKKSQIYILLLIPSLALMLQAMKKSFGSLIEYIIYFTLPALCIYGFSKNTEFSSLNHYLFKLLATLKENPAVYIISSLLILTSLQSISHSIKETIAKRVIFAFIFLILSVISLFYIPPISQINTTNLYITIMITISASFSILLLVSRINLIILFIAINLVSINMLKTEYVSKEAKKIYIEEMKDYQLKKKQIEVKVKKEIYLSMAEGNVSDIDIDKKIEEEVKKKLSEIKLPQEDEIKQTVSKKYYPMLAENLIDMIGRGSFTVYALGFLLLTISTIIRISNKIRNIYDF